MRDAVTRLDLTDWAALGTILAALFSAVAAGSALWMVRDARRTRDEEGRPLVLLSSEVAADGHISFLLKNYGGLAQTVRITFLDPVLTVSGQNVAEMPFFAEQRELMLPGEEARFPFTTVKPYFLRTVPNGAGGHRFEGATGRPVRFRYRIRYANPRTLREYDEQLVLSIAHLAPPRDDRGNALT